jgi:bile acid-coenzyme A ligase
MTEGSPEQVSYGRRLSMLATQHDEGDVAVTFAAEHGGETPVTWRELEARANQMAHFLASRGLGDGDLIVVALRNSPEHLFTTFGAWKLGASVLPLRWDLPEWERDRLLAVSNAKLVVAGWDDPAPGTVTPDDVRATADLPDAPPVEDHVPQYTRLIATSGATGTPKIVVTPSPGVMVVDEQMLNVMGATAGKRYLTTSPLYHVNGWAYAYNPLLQDCPIVLMERFDAARAVELIERYGVNFTCMVPTMLMRVARLPDAKSHDLGSIERLVYGGASIPEWVVHAWFELIPPERFAFSYGGSEGHAIVMTTGDVWLEHPGTVGKPLGGEVKILDEQGNEVPTGEIGEIYLRTGAGGSTFEYIGVPTPPNTPDGFGSFGDMGYVDAEGYLYIADRRRDMIVSGGANVFPAEVEAVISEHPGVLDVVVVGLPDPEWGHRVHAIVQPVDPEHAPDADGLRAHCKARLASYKVPKSFETTTAIPRSAAGKVNRSRMVEERTETPTT